MAKLIEDVIVLKFSKITRDNDADPESPVNNETLSALEQVAQELVGESVVVEIART